MRILNLTQHHATPEQIESGVVNLSEPVSTQVKNLITFNDIAETSLEEMQRRAQELCGLVHAHGTRYVMIGGAPFFAPVLQAVMHSQDIVCLYAFSQRVSEDTMHPDGTVTKVAIFKHVGFVVG